MAETVHLTLKANGQVIKGKSYKESAGRKDTIECISYQHKVHTPNEPGVSVNTARRQHEAVVIRKRIDMSSPLLFKALVKNEKVDGVFKFFRPAEASDKKKETDGTAQFFTVEIENARIASIEQNVAHGIDPANNNEPPLEQVSFVVSKIKWTYEDGGISHLDEVSGS